MHFSVPPILPSFHLTITDERYIFIYTSLQNLNSIHLLEVDSRVGFSYSNVVTLRAFYPLVQSVLFLIVRRTFSAPKLKECRALLAVYILFVKTGSPTTLYDVRSVLIERLISVFPISEFTDIARF